MLRWQCYFLQMMLFNLVSLRLQKKLTKTWKPSSPPDCSRVFAGHHDGQVAQTAQASVVTLSLRSKIQSSPTVIPIVSNTDDVCLTVVTSRKLILVSKLATDGSGDNLKSYFAAKVPSVDLKRVSVFKLAPHQHKAFLSFKFSIPTANREVLLNKPLWLSGSLIKAFIPRYRNNHSVALPRSKR